MSLLLEAEEGGKNHFMLTIPTKYKFASLLPFPLLNFLKILFFRLHLDDGGGAWCPARPVGSAAAAAAAAAAVVSQPAAEPRDPDVAAVDPPPPQQPPPLSPPPSEDEFIQIDLGNLTVVTAVLTQGR